MKTIFLLWAALMVMNLSHGQQVQYSTVTTAVPIPSLRLGICSGKTTNLVFQYDIISVDRGNQNLLVQKVKAAENILQIKAAKEDFPETNLSVVTADKKLHSFTISYNASPAILNYRLLESNIGSSGILSEETMPIGRDLTTAEIKDYSALVAGIQSSTRIKDKKFGVSIRLCGIFIKENVFFFSLQLQNKTTVRYDIESINLMIKDQKQGKRTATQEIQLHPLLFYGNTVWIESITDQQLVIAVPKFTIPDKKDFIIQLREANGGRHLSFSVRNKKLIKATPLQNSL